jgi:hypothetical protein
LIQKRLQRFGFQVHSHASRISQFRDFPVIRVRKPAMAKTQP